MRIVHVKIRNFRCLKEVDIDVDSYTALIGANGSGKSSVLYALDWFFKGHTLTADDAYNDGSWTEDSEEERVVEVTVTFSDLSEYDRSKLEKYGRGTTAKFKRSWRLGEANSKIIGNAFQGPGFSKIRTASGIVNVRTAYRELRRNITQLPELSSRASKQQIEDALMNWESAPYNSYRLEEIDTSEATHLFGFSGQSVIEDCFRMVLVPAASDIVNEVAGAKKGSAIEGLIGALTSKASSAARETWIETHKAAIEELTTNVRGNIESAAAVQVKRVNARLSSFVPNASVKVTPTIPEWVPNPAANILTEVTIDGSTNDIAKQGHGIQRAVMIAMFQSLVPDYELIAATHVRQEGETEEEASSRLDLLISNLPVLFVAIEEPEIYQHPVRARSFARVLSELSEQINVQVMVATHSPYFVRPDQFASLRRFNMSSGAATVTNTTLTELANMANKTEDQVRKILEMRLPTTFSEGFFSDAVVLVEGDTDKIIIETLAEKLDCSLDTEGISIVVTSGKDGIHIPKFLLASFNVPTYIVFDGDAGGALRNNPIDKQKRINDHRLHKKSTELFLTHLPTSRALSGNLPYHFEDPTLVAEHYAIWNDDIESVLESWESFMDALNLNNGSLRSKDALVYRTAVLEARVDDMPDTLRVCMEAIINLKNI